jgi:cyclohexanecarboxyl-CoA dehydrogenase
MDYAFSEEQNALAKRIAEFAAAKVAPHRHADDVRGRYHDGLFADIAEEGLFTLRIPEEYGGRGLDTTSVGIALEELAAADLSVCYPVLNAALVGGVLAANGTPEQLRKWLPPIARGESIVALCLTEPDHGTDAAAIEMRAVPDGDGWVLSGEKASIMCAVYATHGLVFARTGGAGAHGITAFYIPLDEVAREQHSDLGCRSGGRGRLLFDGLRVGRRRRRHARRRIRRSDARIRGLAGVHRPDGHRGRAGRAGRGRRARRPP